MTHRLTQKSWFLALSTSLSVSAAFAQPAPFLSPEVTDKRLVPEDGGLRREAEYKKLLDKESSKNADLEKRLEELRKSFTSDSSQAPSQSTSLMPSDEARTQVTTTPSAKRKAPIPAQSEEHDSVAAASPVVSYVVSEVMEGATILPAGAYVKAKVLSGVEANTIEPYPMLLQLDYAFTGPNRSRLDLSHCFMIAKAKANLSTERVHAEVTELSCVRENGEHVSQPVKGYLAGEDSTFGITGQLISKQGQVLLTAVVANLAKGAGEAVSLAQTTTQLAASNNVTEKATNLTGKASLLTAGKATADAGSMIAQWYLDYARQLVPSIAIGSGRDVWVVMLGTSKVPPLTTQEGAQQ